MKIAGLPVVDAKRPVHLHVTASDTTKGANKDPGACAAALAAKRQFHSTDVRVHIGRLYVKKPTHWVRYQTPAALRSEIVAFDRGGTFEPGDYVIKPLTPVKKPTGKRQGGPDAPKRKHRKFARIHHTITGIRSRGANR